MNRWPSQRFSGSKSLVLGIELLIRLARVPAAEHRTSGARLSARDRVFFARQLSVLIAADVSIVESLFMLRDQNRSRGLSTVLNAVIRDVQNGRTLSRSMAQHQKAFGEFAIRVIAVGEASGTLAQNLDYLASELKKHRTLRGKLIGALVYPTLIAAATLILMSFLIIYLFPKLMPIFLSLDMQLPLTTRIVMGTSQFLTSYGLAMLALFAILFCFAFVLRARCPKWKRIVATLFLYVPLINTFIRQYNMAQSMRSLGLLFKGGMPLSSALSTLAGLSQNPLYKEAWVSIAEAVDRGEQVSAQLKKRPDLFPRAAMHMIAAGERSGDLAANLMYIADAYEDEFDEYTKSFATLLEPALMLFMGLLIGTVAISIITPIYGLTQSLHS
ncbi:MAG TPA: type II secretion system F family protein [Candidatus Paceibacterota bacterium]